MMIVLSPTIHRNQFCKNMSQIQQTHQPQILEIIFGRKSGLFPNSNSSDTLTFWNLKLKKHENYVENRHGPSHPAVSEAWCSLFRCVEVSQKQDWDCSQSNLVYKWHLKTQTQNWNVSPTVLIVCNSSLYQVYCEWRRSPISDMACQIQSAIALHTTVLTEAIHYTHCTFYTFNTFQNSRWRKVRNRYQSAIYMVYLAQKERAEETVWVSHLLYRRTH